MFFISSEIVKCIQVFVNAHFPALHHDNQWRKSFASGCPPSLRLHWCNKSKPLPHLREIYDHKKIYSTIHCIIIDYARLFRWGRGVFPILDDGIILFIPGTQLLLAWHVSQVALYSILQNYFGSKIDDRPNWHRYWECRSNGYNNLQVVHISSFDVNDLGRWRFADFQRPFFNLYPRITGGGTPDFRYSYRIEWNQCDSFAGLNSCSFGGLFLLAVTSKNFPFQNRIAIQLRSSRQFAGDLQKTTLEN